MVSKIMTTISGGNIREYRWAIAAIAFILLWAIAFVTIALVRTP